eukprot:scaffold163571_cov21-Tisochrysis_lutea.AAC.1
MADPECPICRDTFERDIVVTDCGHVFHGSCLNDWFTRQKWCPVCRKQNSDFSTRKLRDANGIVPPADALAEDEEPDRTYCETDVLVFSESIARTMRELAEAQREADRAASEEACLRQQRKELTIESNRLSGRVRAKEEHAAASLKKVTAMGLSSLLNDPKSLKPMS